MHTARLLLCCLLCLGGSLSAQTTATPTDAPPKVRPAAALRTTSGPRYKNRKRFVRQPRRRQGRRRVVLLSSARHKNVGAKARAPRY